ncbi:Vi polysaccharide biosynthesis UDP-N-acetylglucosamine C-6 dehydrogenase TviB [Candidatus Thioglobus sp.]|nr:Vi polysaccharide biosynthesis UDP-N-acetylglucosamine C-6 dehydrogenase TviB [Candidatus Thioglobus sp.]
MDKISIIGLGYVGLPLAVEFSKKFDVVGLDINKLRINELNLGKDSTLEVDASDLLEANRLSFTSNPEVIRDCNIYIITVPTPIDEKKQPNLTHLQDASQMVGKLLDKDNIVIYESTVYPGATEEFCVPILENYSDMKFNKDFFCGYSPERINPGDKKHRLSNIVKVTSGSTPEIAEKIDALYQLIITAGTHKASSMKVAEAAKVIENTQRDVNIALINELSLIFDRLNIETEEVLKAAGSKWNFLPFSPGLVGGHCIGVDPYYLTHKAIQVGYHPEIILAGRRLNDSMPRHVAMQVSKLMFNKNINIVGAKILILGLTFKENCPDLRNTRVLELVHEFVSLNCDVEIYDPWVNIEDVNKLKKINIIKEPLIGAYDTIVIAVGHNEFKLMGAKMIHSFGKTTHILYDVKFLLNETEVDGRL